MVKNLVIVESPAKARTMGRFLGQDYLVMASLGHVRDLPGGELGVAVTNGFTPEYVIPKEKHKVVAELKKAAKGATTIYLATDPDREGEAISWHLMEAAGWSNRATQRVVFHEITESAIKEAFRNPREIDMRLVNAQQARRVLDRLVGYQLSPLLWRKIQRGLSAGRVQSVALRIVVDREREIEAFNAREYWSIEAILQQQSQNGGAAATFNAALQSVKGQRGTLDLPSEAVAQEITNALSGASYTVADVKKKEVHHRPAAPFITSTLQQEAWRKLRFSAKKTMLLAQQLYEGLPLGPEGSVGLITYMRTDSTHVAPQAIQEAKAFIQQKYGPAYLPKSPRVYSKKAKGAQEAHEAIRPTLISREPDELRRHLASEQLRLYDLIWKRMLASQMADVVADSTRVDVEASGPQTGGRSYMFRATGSVVKFLGFRALYSEDLDEASEEDAGSDRQLPALTIGEVLNSLGLGSEQHFTQPPPRYTDATLIRMLEEQGIGRPSTYAPTLSVIQERNYVTKEKGQFKPSMMGMVVSDQLTQHFPTIMDIGFTAQMEEKLDQIASGAKEWVPVLNDFYGPFQEALATATEQMPRVRVEEPSDETCDLCQRPMVIKTSRFGRFLACTGFPECRGKKSLVKKSGVSCPECDSGELVERRGKGRTFHGCTNYPECTFTVRQTPLPEPCPECGSMLVVSGRQSAQCTACKFRGPVPEREAVETA
ncbi:MAG: type I DNA topoisomerase [Chloroflexi bacterium]|nr:type I DNA topoisomerase [Chloroflexota bacterium]